jgi:PRTRC genetic system protein C
MKVVKLKRVFTIVGENKEVVTLPDPNPRYSPEEVMDHYSLDYPKLHTAIIGEGVLSPDGQSMVFEIKDNFGSKG